MVVLAGTAGLVPSAGGVAPASEHRPTGVIGSGDSPQTDPAPLPEYGIETIAYCDEVRDTDGDGNAKCLGRGDAFDADSPFHPYLVLTNVSESHTIRWHVSTPSDQYTVSSTIEPGDTVVSYSSIGIDGTGEVEVRLTIDGRDRSLDSLYVGDAPTATFTNTPTTPEPGDTVRFDASNSSGESVNLDYAWDLDGDGATDATGERVTTSFSEGGRHRNVTLRVTDRYGLSDSVSELVYVNIPPVANFTASSDRIQQGRSVQFVASGRDPDGRIESFEWRFGSNRTVDASGRTVETIPTDSGRFTVSLTAVDERGADATVTRTFAVRADSDGDGLVDERERELGTDPTAADTDGDGLHDGREVELGADPTAADTDDDGLSDGREVELGADPTVADTDGDGLDDAREAEIGTDPAAADTDGDGLDDAREVELGTDPTAADTDGDGLGDRREVELGSDPTAADTDGDGLDDAREVELGSDPTAADTDGDGLDDAREVELGTDPAAADTDGDGLDDAREIELGTDPRAADTDDDRIEDGREVRRDLDPLDADMDDDGVLDGEELERGSSPRDADTDDDLFADRIDPFPSLVWFPLGLIQLLATAALYVGAIRFR
ncbi:PKD domain-containing protein [Halorubrum trapanicum]|uniref:PKD domain-containing protein n=1 Tax=Halorubrum trapanicum TaxID=29284 RepID=UPI0012FE0B10|nr:PKD domain-containing protein [Halorubrum trapanicum]